MSETAYHISGFARASARRALGTLAMAAVVLGSQALSAPAQDNSPYGRAVRLAEQGNLNAIEPAIAKAKAAKRAVDINTTVMIVSDKVISSLGEDLRKYVFPGPDAPGAIRINGRAPEAGTAAWSLQATPVTEEQVSLLNDTVRKNSDAVVASLFGMRVMDMQQVAIQLIPDRGFPVIGAGGEPEMEMVPEKDAMVKRVRMAPRTVAIRFRPVANDQGSELSIRFYDESRPFDPHPVASLNQTLSWSFPGRREVMLGPPEYEFSALPAGAPSYVKAPRPGYLLLSGIMAIGGEKVRQGVPILDLIPVVGEAVFSSESKVHYRISVYLVLEARLAR